MMTHRPSCRALALSALLLFPGAAPEHIVFAPVAGSAVERTWTTEHDLTSQRMVLKTGDVERVLPAEMRIQSRQVIEAVDSFLACAEGRPTLFRRSFDTVDRTAEITMKGADRALSSTVSSPLAGTSVLFTWVPREGEYGRCFDAKEIEEHHLADLRADFDGRVFLPAGDVEPGASWTVEPAALRDVFAHGGAFEFKENEDGGTLIERSLRSGVGGGLDRAFGDSAEGSATVTFERVVEEEGRRIAVLAIEASVKYSADQTDHVRQEMQRDERERSVQYEEATLVFEFHGGGELRWDLAGNRATNLKLAGRESVTYDIAQRRVEDGDAGPIQRQEMTMLGSLTIGLTCEPSEVREAPGPPEGQPR